MVAAGLLWEWPSVRLVSVRLVGLVHLVHVRFDLNHAPGTGRHRCGACPRASESPMRDLSRVGACARRIDSCRCYRVFPGVARGGTDYTDTDQTDQMDQTDTDGTDTFGRWCRGGWGRLSGLGAGVCPLGQRPFGLFGPLGPCPFLLLLLSCVPRALRYLFPNFNPLSHQQAAYETFCFSPPCGFRNHLPAGGGRRRETG